MPLLGHMDPANVWRTLLPRLCLFSKCRHGQGSKKRLWRGVTISSLFIKFPLTVKSFWPLSFRLLQVVPQVGSHLWWPGLSLGWGDLVWLCFRKCIHFSGIWRFLLNWLSASSLVIIYSILTLYVAGGCLWWQGGIAFSPPLQGRGLYLPNVMFTALL